MQKRDARDLFIDPKIRKSGLLKSLLRGFRHRREEEGGETPYEYGKPSLRDTPSRGRDSGDGMKKVVCL